MAKPWQRFPLKRKERRVKSRILIVCEGSETEPNYFKAFRVTSVKVEVVGTGFNTISLVEKAIILRDEVDEGEEYDQVWCVFDKDDFSKQNAQRAFDLAAKEKIKVGYSNQSFELWYYLHFTYHSTALSRSDYVQKLRVFLGEKYKKNDRNMYALLLDKQENAIKNAKKLADFYPQDKNIVTCDPYTSVHQLVEVLNKNIS